MKRCRPTKQRTGFVPVMDTPDEPPARRLTQRHTTAGTMPAAFTAAPAARLLRPRTGGARLGARRRAAGAVACAARPPGDGARALELGWRFQHRGSGDGAASRDCAACRGGGAEECRFCSATGVLTLGDKLLCSVDGGTECPVCEGSGETTCGRCQGSGQVANWMF